METIGGAMSNPHGEHGTTHILNGDDDYDPIVFNLNKSHLKSTVLTATFSIYNFVSVCLLSM